MGWLLKMGPYVALMLVSSVLFVSATTDKNCDLASPIAAIDVSSSDSPNNNYLHLDAINLNQLNKASCTWNITNGMNNAILDLGAIVLAPTDNLTVTGFNQVQLNEGNVTSTVLFQSSGSPPTGLINTAAFTYIIVKLDVSPNSTIDRSFSTVYYWNSTFYHLQKETGLLSFPLNDPNNKSLATALELRPDMQYPDRLVMLNVTQLPKKYKLTIDGVVLDDNKPRPTILLQAAGSPTIKISLDYTPVKGEVFQVRYTLVSRSCSRVFEPKPTESFPILYPNRLSSEPSAPIKCAQYYTTSPGYKFQVLIEANASGLADPNDDVAFYDESKLVLGLNDPALMYFRTIDNIIESNKVLVVYNSPLASTPNPTFKPPVMKVIPVAQGTVFMVSDKSQKVPVKTDGKSSITHVLYPYDLGVEGKNILVEFPTGVIKPGTMSISIYNSESNVGSPILTLGQFDQLPLAVPSNTPLMRVVYSGNVQLDVIYSLVDSSTSCKKLSTFSPTFEVQGGSSSGTCSWYIPEATTSNYTVVSPTIVKIPVGKVLTVTNFTKSGTTVTKFNGSISEYYLPDFFLTSSNAYQFSLDTVNTTADNLHLLIAKKSDYLNETVKINSVENVKSISSANYPGYYPVGVAQNWMFLGDAKKDWALITVQDVHLASPHTLSIVAAENMEKLQGDQNLTAVGDILTPFPFSLNLDSKVNRLTDFSKRGFKVDLQYPGVAGNVDASKGDALISFNSSIATPGGKSLAIYRISTDLKSATSSSDTILRINVTLANSLEKTKATLKIYDSTSLRQSSAHFANGDIDAKSNQGSFLTSTNTAFIVYEYSASFATKADFSVNFTVSHEKCSNSHYNVTKCATTDRCITDLMACNGKDDCGDYTDELYCNGTSPPPPAPSPPAASGGGVNALVVIFVLMPMSAILGIVGYIYLPQFLMRIRRGRYSEFRDLSEVS